MQPDLIEELLSSIDQPLQIAHDKESKRDYLLCDYNRDADSYRSPWSNKYDPPLSDGAVPNAKLRQLEIEANACFDVFRELYYEGGVSSVYLWELESGSGFAACVLVKKTQDQSKKGHPMQGTWDSIHVLECADKPNAVHITLISTIQLGLETKSDATGKVNLAGGLTRKAERTFGMDKTKGEGYIQAMGTMVEDMENKMRSQIETIYFGRTKDIALVLRNQLSKSDMQQRKALQGDLGAALAAKRGK